MRGGISIGRIWGVPLYADGGALLLLGLFSWFSGYSYASVSPNLGLVFGLLTGIVLLFSILLHELAHTYVAQSFGIKVKQVALSLTGGFTEMDQEYKTPWSAFAVSVIGPLVSIAFGFGMFVLANELGLGNVIGQFTPEIRRNPELIRGLLEKLGNWRVLSALMCWEIACLNIIWGIFNLLPFFPLDGEQALRAILWKLSGDRFRSGIWSARVGQFSGNLLIGLGLFLLLGGGGLDSLWLMLVGWLISSTAGAKLQLSSIQQALLSVSCEMAMTRDFRIVDGEITIREFVDRYLLLEEKSPVFVANVNGRDRGIVQVEKVRSIDPSFWHQMKVLEIVKPIGELATADLNQNLAWAINTLESNQLRSLTVLSPVGSIAGVIDRGDILMALARKLKWVVPESFVKQIKEEGRFPADFRIAEISAQLLNSNE
ncbi:MAG: site-2 protease family protein [Pseudanabaenaceae cyanobacterium]